MRSTRQLLPLLGLLTFSIACGDDDPATNSVDGGADAQQDAASNRDGSQPDASATPEAGTDAETAPDAQTAMQYQEMEPNGGNPISDVNEIELGWEVSGNIGADDVDVFFFDAEPGKVFRITWTNADRSWGPELAIFDAGRKDEAAGSDYVKVLKDTALPYVEFFSFGEGGHYISIRSPTAGTGDYGFTLKETAPENATGDTILFPSTINTTLPNAGAVVLHPFEAAEGTDIEIRVDAQELPSPSDLDTRIAVYSAKTKSWIMRNDDDGVTVDSRVSAPLPEGGLLWLVFENLSLEAPLTNLSYRLTSKQNAN